MVLKKYVYYSTNLILLAYSVVKTDPLYEHYGSLVHSTCSSGTRPNISVQSNFRKLNEDVKIHVNTIHEILSKINRWAN